MGFLRCFLSTVAVFFTFHSGVAFSESLKTNDLRSELLKQKDIRWKISDQSDLNTNDFEFVNGLDESGSFKPFIDSRLDESKHLAAQLDWRDRNGYNWLTPIRNQGKCGSCVSFAALGMTEAIMRIRSNAPTMNIDLSEQYLFSQIGKCNSGAGTENSMIRMLNSGTPDEMCNEYHSGRLGIDGTTSQACSDVSQRKYRIQSFTRVGRYSIKNALQYGPVMTTMKVYEDFIFYKSGVYKHVTGKFLGGHAIVIVGYDDSKQAWIVRNSWSENWGDQGYFYIGYANSVSLGNFNHQARMNNVQKYGWSNVSSPYSVVQNNFNLELERKGGSSDIEASLSSMDSVVATRNVDASESQVNMDTSELDDGSYTLKMNSGWSKNHYSKIIVAKNAPTVKMELESLSDDLQDLNGKADFIGHFEVEGAPFTHAYLVVRNMSGDEVQRSETPNPGEESKFGWRTTRVEDGKYNVTLEGEVGDLYSFATEPVEVLVNNQTDE